MCGITGMLTRRSIDQPVLRSMTDELTHRGPDDSGLWIDEHAGIGLGHRRLSIVDLSAAGHQPMESPCGRYMFIFNGEIYNHAELRAEVEAEAGGVVWRGHSDTETLLACISRWGFSRALDKAVGMFAMAMWDKAERKLTLVRDRMGEKPLYYGWAGGSFLFGSELKALRRAPVFDNRISRRALDLFVRRSYVPTPLSIYEGIYKLHAGALLTIDIEAAQAPPSSFAGDPFSSASLRLERYWKYEEALVAGAANPVRTSEEALEELERRLIASARSQSVADVPVGTFLSGGIDSSTVAAVQQSHTSSRVETFTIGFSEAGFNEAVFAKAVAGHLGTAHHELYVSARDALDVIPRLGTIYDEPFADSSQIPTHLLSAFARRSVTVALSGDGGDELFGGYNRYVAIQKHQRRLAALPRPARRLAAGMISAIGTGRIDRIGSRIPKLKSVPQLGAKAQKLARLLKEADSLSAVYSNLTTQWELSSDLVRGAGDRRDWPAQEEHHGIEAATQMMLWDTVSYLPDDILCKVDRASMAVSLETRAPFLDHRLVEFSARIPLAMKIRPDGGKWILRQLLYKYVPRELVDRPKAGFAIPLGQWLRGPLRDWSEALLDERLLDEQDYFDAALVSDRWRTHLSGSRDYSAALWPILMFQAWARSAESTAALGEQGPAELRQARIA